MERQKRNRRPLGRGSGGFKAVTKGLDVIIPDTRKPNSMRDTQELLRSFVLQKSGGYCWYCGIVLEGNKWIVEHVIPRSKGGSNTPDNVVPSCRSCNSLKSNLTLDEFRPKIAHKMSGAPKFTREHLRFLQDEYGIDPYNREQPVVFWCEEKGLMP